MAYSRRFASCVSLKSVKVKIGRQAPAQLAQAIKQLCHGWFLDNLKRPAADKVQVDFLTFFQVKCLHQPRRKPHRQ